MKPIYWLGLLLCTFGTQAAENGMITVHPQPLDTILTNPGIGVETFQDNWGMPLQTPEQYPATTVDYYRFYWDELEPQEGQINFAMLDSIIAKAKAQTP
ncbi:MAG: beta-galactosidase, partial [Plesiomonas shigelloides]